LRALVRLVKHWAKSKKVHSAKDGALSSYGYCMLATAYMLSIGGVPPLLSRSARRENPYLSSQQALKHVLDCKTAKRARPAKLWGPPEEILPSGEAVEEYSYPEQLFGSFLSWMETSVFSFADDSSCAALNGGPGAVPLASRQIVSVRPRDQEELRADICWSPKKDHWSPECSPVFLLIEEPLSGENVARCVKLTGFKSIHNEIKRAAKFLSGGLDRRAAAKRFKALLSLPPLTAAAKLHYGIGNHGADKGAEGGKGKQPWGPSQPQPPLGQGLKRPLPVLMSAAGKAHGRGGKFAGSPWRPPLMQMRVPVGNTPRAPVARTLVGGSAVRPAPPRALMVRTPGARPSTARSPPGFVRAPWSASTVRPTVVPSVGRPRPLTRALGKGRGMLTVRGLQPPRRT